MELIFALLLGAAGGMWVYKRYMAKDAANFQSQVLARFTGVWPVFPTSPWDETVKARADEIAAGFIEQGNGFPKYVQPYFYNDVIEGPDGVKKSTASLDWQNCLVLFMQDYLRRVDDFHAKQYAKDPQAAQTHLAGQKQSLNTL